MAADAHLVDLAMTEVRCSFAVAESNFATYVDWFRRRQLAEHHLSGTRRPDHLQDHDKLKVLTGSAAIEFSEECLRQLQFEDEINDE